MGFFKKSLDKYSTLEATTRALTLQYLRYEHLPRSERLLKMFTTRGGWNDVPEETLRQIVEALGPKGRREQLPESSSEDDTHRWHLLEIAAFIHGGEACQVENVLQTLGLEAAAIALAYRSDNLTSVWHSKVLQHAMCLAPDVGAVLVKAALHHCESGEFEEALPLFERGIKRMEEESGLVTSMTKFAESQGIDLPSEWKEVAAEEKEESIIKGIYEECRKKVDQGYSVEEEEDNTTQGDLIKTIAHQPGEVFNFRTADGQKLSLESLPEMIRIRRMGILLPKGPNLWDHNFPFFIRTAAGAWDLSNETMDICIRSIVDARSAAEVVERLEDGAAPQLDAWTWTNAARAREYGISKLKDFAERKYKERQEKLVQLFHTLADNLATHDEVPNTIAAMFHAAAQAIVQDDADIVRGAARDLSGEEFASTIVLFEKLIDEMKKLGVEDTYRPELRWFGDIFGSEVARRQGTEGEH